jgi:ABC-2 type transport system permease protein
MWVACMVIGMLAAFFYFGFVYWVQDIPRGGNMPLLLLAVPAFAGAVAALGLAAGAFFRNGDDALKILLPTSVPLVFLAGFAWPLDAMPRWLATLAWASPATGGMHLFIRLNQMGARASEIVGPLATLLLLIIFYLSIFLIRITRPVPRPG